MADTLAAAAGLCSQSNTAAAAAAAAGEICPFFQLLTDCLNEIRTLSGAHGDDLVLLGPLSLSIAFNRYGWQ